MRKFVIKNRQKRKYTKKSEEVSSSLSKTAYGMLPILIMAIAFMATVIISVPFRDTFSHISFTIQLPEFSLSNPLTFFQTIAQDVSLINITLWSTILIILTDVNTAAITMAQVIFHVLLLLNPLPLFIAFGDGLKALGMMFESVFIVVMQGVISTYVIFLQSSLFVVSGILTILGTILSTFVTLLLEIGKVSFMMVSTSTQFISDSIIIIFQMISNVAVIIEQSIVDVSAALVHLLLMMIEAVMGWFVAVYLTITAVVSQFLHAIIHLIEIPFTLLYTFWMRIKPYVDVFDRHLQLAGSDFINGFNSLGKVTNLLSSSK